MKSSREKAYEKERILGGDLLFTDAWMASLDEQPERISAPEQ